MRASSVVEVSVQNTDIISEFNAPEPDLTLLRRDRDVTKVPGVDDILLIVEVSDSSLRFDRKVKLPIYAEAGIPEVWIVNTPEERVECCRDPVDNRYAAVRLFRDDEEIDALLVPELGTIPARHLLKRVEARRQKRGSHIVRARTLCGRRRTHIGGEVGFRLP